MTGWSIRFSDFWAGRWEFAEIKTSRNYDRVVDDPTKMPGTKWFEGAELNFAENLLWYRGDRTAMIFKGEGKESKKITYVELAVRNVVHGRPVLNKDALANPEALNLYQDLPELKK